MRAIFIVAALFCAFLTGNRMAHPYIDGDLFWQRHLGEFVLTHHALPTTLGSDVFSAPNAAWVPQEWLFSIVVALAYRANALWLLSVISGLAMLLALMLMAVRARRAGASLLSTLAVLLFTFICMQPPFSTRAQVWVWPLFAALLLVLDLEGPLLWLAVPVVVLWANLHASVMIAIPVVWLDAALYLWKKYAENQGKRATLERASRKQRRRDLESLQEAPLLADPGVRTRLLLCVATPLAVLCTPLGVRLPEYAFNLLFNNPVKTYIEEWQPLNHLSLQDVMGLLPLLAICLYGASKLWKSRPRDVVLPVLMAVWAFLAIRNVALFVIAAVVPASLAVDAGEGWESPLDRRPYGMLAMLSAPLLVLLIGYVGFIARPLFVPWVPPTQSMAALARIPGEHRLACGEYSWCSVALGEPNIRILLDGRADPYPPRVWAAYAAISRVYQNWQGAVSDFGVNAILAWQGSALEKALKTEPGWRQIPDKDACCSLFVRQAH